MNKARSDANNFGKNLRMLMEAHGISYQVLSAKTGIPHSSLHEYVKGKHRIPLENAVKCAQYFDKSLDEMLSPLGDVASEDFAQRT